MQRLTWPANVYGHMALLFLRNGDFDKMLEVLYFLVRSPDQAIGSLEEKSLQEIFSACVLKGHINGAIVSQIDNFQLNFSFNTLLVIRV